MARIRTIKPELWQDERIGTLPIDVRLLFIGLISHADDEGRLRGNPLLIRSLVFPYDAGVDVEVGLDHLARIGRIVRYEIGGEHYIQVVKFVEHQRIEKPKPSAFPPPPEVADESRTHPGTVPESSAKDHGRKGSRKGSGSGSGSPPPPAPSRGAKTAEVVVEELPDGSLPPTIDGCWEFIQRQREAMGLKRESQRPAKFGEWYENAASPAGPEGVSSALQLYLGDRDFAQKGWPTAVFITPGVFDARVRSAP